MELSVIIVSFNVRDYLRQSLISAQKASENIDCEIIVVDNNSADDSCTLVEQEYPEVILLRNNENTGFSAANNQAIKVAKGRYILLLNPDTQFDDDIFIKCISFMKNHPDAGALGVRMLNGEGIFLPESRRSFPTLSGTFYKSFGFSFLFPKIRQFNKYYLPDINIDESAVTEIISGAFMFIRHETLNKAGILDEDFFMYGEDIDLSYRLMKTGFKNYYLSNVQITHFKGKSTDRTNFSDILHFYRAMRIFLRKRIADGTYNSSYFVIIPVIYFREGLALLNRLTCIIMRR